MKRKILSLVFLFGLILGNQQLHACDGSAVSITSVVDNQDGTYSITMNICFALDVNWGGTNDFDLVFSGGTFTSIDSNSPNTLNGSYEWCDDCFLNDNGTGSPNDDFYDCVNPTTVNTSASGNISGNTLTFSNDDTSPGADAWMPDDMINGVQSDNCVNNPEEICFTITVVTNGLPDNLHFDGAEDDVGPTMADGGCPEDHPIPAPSTPITGCTGTSTDTGGDLLDYGPSESWTQTYCSDNGEPIQLDFTSFALEASATCAYDYLNIYDGNSTGSPLIGQYCGTNSPGIIIASGTCITLEFSSDLSFQAAGWVAEISCGCTAPDANFTPPTGCEGNGIDFTNTGDQYSGNPSNNPYTYSWDFTSGTPSTSTDENPTGVVWNTAGTYNVDFTMCLASDNTCCDTESASVTITAPPTLTATPSPETCDGDGDGSIDLTVTGGTAGFTYAWDNGAGSGEDASGLDDGTYTVTVTDANGCIVTASATVDPGTMPTASFTTSGLACLSTNNISFTNNSTDATSYSWDFGDGSGTSTDSDPSYTYSSAGTFTVTLTATDANGCTDVTTMSVTIFDEPVVTLTPTAESCLGQNDGSISSSVSGGNPGYTYSWNPTGTGSDPSGLAPNTYTVTVTDANGCTGTATTTVDPGTTIVAGFDPVVNTCLTGNTTSFNNTGTTGVTYSWDFGDGSGTSTDENPTYSYTTAGTYTITQTVSSGPCTDTYTQDITIYDEPTVALTPTDVTCNGLSDGSIASTVTGGTAGYTYAWTPSGTGANPSGLGANTYTVTVTDANGCTATATTTINEPDPLVLNTTQNNVTCFGLTDGDATVTATGGSGIYTYSWDDPSTQTTQTATGLAAGTYTVTVNDGNCTETISVTITEPTEITATNSSNPSTCGNANGDATVNPSGGSGTYTYSWDDPSSQTTQTATGLAAGTYNVTINDGGCTLVVSVTVSDSGGPTITIDNSTNVSCNGGSDGTADITITGGTPPYTILWSDGTTPSDEDITGLSAGTVTVTVTDASGCVTSESVTITEPTPITLTTSSTNPSCAGASDGDVTVTPSGGTPTYTYLWDDGAGQTSSTATGLPSGTYNVTVTDNAGCTETTSVTISDPVSMTLAGTSTPVSCVGSTDGTIDLSITDGTPTYTFAWTPSGATVEDPSGLGTGDHTVTVTDANGCIATTTINVADATPITTSTSGNDASCNGASDGDATVTAGGGAGSFTYLWDDASAQTTSTATGLPAGTYNVTVTDANGCTATDTYTVGEPTPIVLTGSSTPSTCGASNGSVTISATGGSGTYTYSWDDPSTQTTATASNLPAGTYTVTVNDGACTETLAVTISDAGGPTISITATTPASCNGASDGTATSEATGGQPPYTYLWDAAAGGQTTAQATGLAAGDYTVTVTDDNECSVSATATITEPDPITVTLTPTDASCFGVCDGEISVSAIGGSNNYTYLWDDANFQTSNPATGLCAGTYEVTVTDDNGCTTTASASIAEPVEITVTTTTVPSNCGQADGSATATASNGVEPYTYVWNDPFTTSGATVNNLVAGTYTVTVTDDNGCIVTANADVLDGAGPVITLDSTTNVTCFGLCDGAGYISITGGTPGFTYAWDNGETTEDATALCAGDNIITITDAAGCNASLTVNITQPAQLVAAINDFNDASCYGLCNGTANASVSGGTTPYTYLWDDVSATTSASVSNLCAGNYNVQVTDSNNCTATASVTISQPDTLILTVSSVNPTCYEVCDGTATANVTGGTPTYTYAWGDGQSNATATNLCDGVVSVNITDANGCTAGTSVLLDNPDELIMSIVSSSDASCFGVCDGNAEVTATGGTGVINTSWDNGDNGNAIIGLCAGDYLATSTDGNGCTATQLVTINEPDQITVTINATNPTCFEACNGILDATIIGGSGTYTIQWNDPLLSTTEDLSDLCASTFTVNVTDDNGCTGTATATLTDPAEIQISTSTTTATCGNNDGSATVSLLGGGIAPFTYLWDDAGAQTSATATGLIAGTYNITVTDANGCTAVATANVLDLGSPTVTINSSGDASCYGICDGFANLTISDGTPPYSILWDNGNTTSTPNDLCAGTNSVTVTDDVGCIASTSVDINQPDTLITTLGAITDPSCADVCDGSAEVIVSGGTPTYTYTWNDGAGQTTAIATNLCDGTYGVTIQDANGCTVTTEATLTDPTPLQTTTNSTEAYCSLATGTATVSPDNGQSPFVYSWDGGLGANATITDLLPGWYYVDVTDGNGCTARDSVEVLDTPGGVATISDSTGVSCPGVADGSATVSMAGGVAPFTYAWDNGETAVTATSLDPGTHVVTITDDAGCVTNVSVVIIDATPLVLTMNDNPASCYATCDGSAWVDVTGGTTPYSYLWDDPLNQTTDSISGLCGDSTYVVTITDNNGCTEQSSVTITQPEEVTATSTAVPSNCQQYNGSVTVNPAGGTPGYTYLWDDPSAQTAATATGLNAGTYSVIVTDANNCSITETVEIVDLNGPVSDIIDSAMVSCFGGNNGYATAEVTGGTSPYSIYWPVTGGTSLTDANLSAGVHSVEITDATGCVTTSFVTITEPAELVYNLDSTNVSCFNACDGTANITVTGGTLPYSYLWDDPNNSTNDTITDLCAGNYTVIVTDDNNCTISTNFEITEPPFVSATVTTTPASCTGMMDGTATVAVVNAADPYTVSWVPGGQTTITATNLGAGDYTVTILDDNGCTTTASGTVTEPDGVTSNISSSINVSCFGGNDGSATVDYSGGTPTYTINWPHDNSDNATATGLSAGTYQVTVTDLNGCSSTSEVTITQPQQLVANTSSQDALCFGECNGEATASASGGTGTYTYQWDANANLQTTITAIDLCAGAFTVTVMDENGCTATSVATVAEPTPISLVTSNTPSNCGQNNGEACVSVAGGTPPFTYQWNDALTQTTSCAYAIVGGSYQVTVTDNNGCDEVATVNVNDIEAPTVTIDNVINLLCANDGGGAIEASAVGGVNPYTIEWTDQNGSTLAEVSDDISGLDGGCYTITVTDVAGCVGSITACVDEPLGMNSAITNVIDASCFGSCNGQATMNISGGTGLYTYLWDDPAGQTTATATGLCAGTYTCIGTDINGCTTSSTVTIEEPTPLVVDLTNQVDVLCYGEETGSLSISATGGTAPYFYTWNPNVGSNATVTNLGAEQYCVTVNDINGCSVSDCYTITEPTPLLTTTSSTPSTCGDGNGEAEVTASGGTSPYQYLWDANANNQTTGEATSLYAGSYNVTTTDANGCVLLNNITVNDIPGPTIVVDSVINVSCFGGSDGQIFTSSTNGTAPFTYIWSPATANGEDPIGLSAGSYTVKIIDNNGCEDNTIALITEPEVLRLIIDVVDPVLCYGDSTQLFTTVSGGTGPYAYVWDDPALSGGGPFFVGPDVSATYGLTVYDEAGCQASGTVNVTVLPPLEVSTVDTLEMCFGESVSFCAEATSGNGGPYTYTWDNGVNSDCQTVSPPVTTTFTVTADDGCSLVATDSVVVIVHPLPEIYINADDLEGCTPHTVNFSLNTDIGTSFEWDYDGDGIIDDYTDSPTFTYLDPGTYDVSLTAYSDEGCMNSDFEAGYITVYGLPTAEFSFMPNPGNLIENIVTFTDESYTDIVEWDWDFGFDTSSVTNPVITYPDTGFFPVTLIVTDVNGCQDTTMKEVEIEPEYIIFIPNAFSPDGDGTNDFFYPQGVGIDPNPECYAFYIFDRWGNRIWETHNVDGRWDGRANDGNDVAQIDVYVWVIHTCDYLGNKHKYVGHVTLLK